MPGSQCHVVCIPVWELRSQLVHSFGWEGPWHHDPNKFSKECMLQVPLVWSHDCAFLCIYERSTNYFTHQRVMAVVYNNNNYLVSVLKSTAEHSLPFPLTTGWVNKIVIIIHFIDIS